MLLQAQSFLGPCTAVCTSDDGGVLAACGGTLHYYNENGIHRKGTLLETDRILLIKGSSVVGFAQCRYHVVRYYEKDGVLMSAKNCIQTSEPIVGFMPISEEKVLVATFNGCILEYFNQVRTRTVYQHRSAAMCVSLMGASVAVVGGMCGDLSRVDLTSGDVNKLKGHVSTGHIRSISIDGEYILSAGDDRTAKLWHGDTLLWTLEAHTTRIWSTAIKYPFMATGSEDGCVLLWKHDPNHCNNGWRVSSSSDVTTHGAIWGISLTIYEGYVQVAYGTSSGAVAVCNHDTLSDSSASSDLTTKLAIQSCNTTARVVRLISEDVICVIFSCGSLYLATVSNGSERLVASSTNFLSATEVAGCLDELVLGTSTGSILQVSVETGLVTNMSPSHVSSKITTVACSSGAAAWLATDAKGNVIYKKSKDANATCLQHGEKSLPTVAACFEKDNTLAIIIGFKNGVIRYGTSSTATFRSISIGTGRVVSLLIGAGDLVLATTESGIVAQFSAFDKNIIDSHQTSLKDCLCGLPIIPDCVSTTKRHKSQQWLLFHISENTIIATSIPSGENLWSVPCKGISRRTMSINGFGLSMVRGSRDIIVKKLRANRENAGEVRFLSENFFLSRDAQGIGSITATDRRQYVVVGEQGDAVLIDGEKEGLGITQKLLPHHASGFKCCSQRGDIAVAGGGDDTLCVWDISQNPARLISTINLSKNTDVSQRVLCVHICDKTNLIIAGTSAGTVHSVEYPYGPQNISDRFLAVPDDFGACLSVDVFDGLIAVGGSCGRVCLSRMTQRDDVKVLKVHQSGVNCLSVGFDELEKKYVIVTGGDDQSLSVVRATISDMITVSSITATGSIVTAAFRAVRLSADCDYFMSLSSDQRLLIHTKCSQSDIGYSLDSGTITNVTRPTGLSLCQGDVVVVGQGIEQLSLII